MEGSTSCAQTAMENTQGANAPWIEYVRDFMFRYKEIGENYYGKWWDIVDTEYPEYFEEDDMPRGEVTQSTNVPKTCFAEK